MQISLPTLLSLSYHLTLALPLLLSLPHTPPSPQPIPLSLRSRHTLYIDQKLQIYKTTNTTTPLNHNLYHQRNVNPLPPNTSNISLNHELYSKRHVITTPPTNKTTSATGTDLDNAPDVPDTEKMCSAAVAALHGRVVNDAGIAACYNVMAFDNATGGFGAEVGFWSVGKPRGKWAEVEGVDVGVVFEGAGGLRIGSLGKRDGGGSEGEGEALVPVVEREEAKDLWRRRSAVGPGYVGGMEIEGRVDGNVSLVGIDVTTLRTLLTPTITLSFTTTNGTTLTTTLSTNTTSFLTGFFAFPNSTTKSSEASVLVAAGFKQEYVLPGTSMVGFPTSLVVTCIWTVVCLVVQGWGVWRKWRAREEYRWRVRRRERVGGKGGWCGA